MCGWMLNLICSSGASLLLRLWGVLVDVEFVCFSSGASLLLRFGGVWVDVKLLFLFWCMERLPASWEARLGRRISDCIVASKV